MPTSHAAVTGLHVDRFDCVDLSKFCSNAQVFRLSDILNLPSLSSPPANLRNRPLCQQVSRHQLISKHNKRSALLREPSASLSVPQFTACPLAHFTDASETIGLS